MDQLLDYTEQTALPQSIGWMKNAAGVARKYGVKMVAYEAGQHLVGVLGGENNEVLTKLFMRANAHPRMGQIYTKYFQAWQDTGSGLMCAFSSVSPWSKWGRWGLLEYADSPETASPKFMATLRWAKSLGQAVNVPEPSNTSGAGNGNR